ncbi:LysR family transcriptional regulator [Zhihengliuella somnathii]
MPDYTLRQLECFVAVAEHGSLSAAAKALHLSDSAVSGAVTELEHSLDARLTIRRKAHGVVLTPSGRYVLDHARGILRSAHDLTLHAKDGGTELRGTLMLGSYVTLAPTVLARLIDGFAERYPAVELDFLDGGQTEMHDYVATGRVDLAITYDFNLPTGLESMHLYGATPNVVLAAEHPLSGRESLSLAELAEEPMILLDVHTSRENTLSMFTEANLEPAIRFRTSNYEVTRSLVARGMGYAILVQQPAGAQSYEGRELVTRRIKPAPKSIGVSLVWQRGTKPSQAARAMIDLAQEIYGGGPATGR